jgi:transposase
MNIEISSLPDDVPSLKEIIAAQYLEYKKNQEQITYLQEMVRLLKNEIFGRKSEIRKDPDHNQMPLFGTPQAVAAPQPAKVTVEAHTRKKQGRKPLPKDLARIEVIHDIPEEQKHCACGMDLTRIGEQVCEKLDYIPAKLQVIRHIRPKYACKGCEGVEDAGPAVKIAPPPAQLIAKSIATEGLIAHVVVSKFADGLPLYRQEKIFSRYGIDLPRATLANWMVQAAEQCRPLVELLKTEIRSGPVINLDESTVQVLNEPGRSNTTKSYMWVFSGSDPQHRAVVYHYHPTRTGQVALDFLGDYKGYVQSDAFSGYDQLARKEGIIHLGCWAHARRNFMDIANVLKKDRSKASTKGLAEEPLDFIGNLYQLEERAKDLALSYDEIYQLRQKQARPILVSFKLWLDANHFLTPPKSLLGKAIRYTLNHWSKLIVYIEDGRLTPDNNMAENAIRPFVLGRKNWLFAGAPKGAEASAIFFSLIETAKANGLEPYAYLRYVFTKLPLVKTTGAYKALLPQHLDCKLLSADAAC